VGWFLWHFIEYLARDNIALLKLTLKNLALGGLVFAVAGAYWLIPAAVQAQPAWQRFDIKHWQAFAAGGYGSVNTTLNVLSLHGFWGQGQAWSKQFAWPQDYPLFWLGFLLVAMLILIGLVSGFRNHTSRKTVLFFAILGLLAFVFATGVGETVFKGFNLCLYQNIFFWPGFRDSQKFSGLLALSYAVLGGFGASRVLSFLKTCRLGLIGSLHLMSSIPLAFGFLALGGFWGQLQPVWYPPVWNRAKETLRQESPGSKTLFLPWHGYLSFKFNNDIVIANPAGKFFGEGAIVSRSVELGGIYDQERDPEYDQLDKAVSGRLSLSPDRTIDFLAAQNIKYIVYFQDLKKTDNLKYEFLSSDRLRPIIKDGQLVMSEIKPD